MKKCLNCGLEKELNSFRWKLKSKNLKKANCKDCDKAYDKKFHQNRTVEKKQQKLNKATSRLDEITEKICLFLMNNPCVDCGQSDVRTLDFDHQRDKTRNVSELMNKWSWETILSEIEKCQVRCANCHRIKTHTEINSRKHRFQLRLT